jgi:ketosteroid isomerase-like protein
MSNLGTIQAIYEAFGRGDVPFILSKLSDDVQWEHWDDNAAVSSGKIPYLKSRTGKAGAAEFFGALASIDIKEFGVVNLLEGGNQVCGLCHIDSTVKATGKRIRDSEIHLWTLDKAGRVTSFRHYIDTAKHLAAHA